MQVTTPSRDGNPLELQMEGEDASLMEIVHKEILFDDRVVFAGIVTPHPLLERTIMKVQTRGIKPLEVVVSVGTKIIEESGELLAQFNKLFAKEE